MKSQDLVAKAERLQQRIDELWAMCDNDWDLNRTPEDVEEDFHNKGGNLLKEELADVEFQIELATEQESLINANNWQLQLMLVGLVTELERQTKGMPRPYCPVNAKNLLKSFQMGLAIVNNMKRLEIIGESQ